jgi:hypothetical protein
LARTERVVGCTVLQVVIGTLTSLSSRLRAGEF